jgi:OHCU decarboxylase
MSSSALEHLNSLLPDQAEREFLKCCGSTRWAREMASARPFADVDRLFGQAERICWSLSEQDWLEAFRAHPKIGERKAAAVQSEQAQTWSAQEQAGIADTATETKAELAARNQEYEERFGFIFIVCASGKTSAEMLAILTERLQNDTEAELRAAAEEQRKITRLRLEKLLA